MLRLELKRCVKVLIENYKPEKIIIFGSIATGNVSENSDIDMVIIKKTSARFLDRIGEVMRLLRPKVALDVLVYTPEEYKDLIQTRWFFQDEIEAKGVSIYER